MRLPGDAPAAVEGRADGPSRVVCFGPNVVETVYALGQGHRMAGVTVYCDYPPEVTDLPKVGDYLNPDFERLTVIQPDLILSQGQNDKLTQFADQSGFPIVHVKMDTLAGIARGIAIISEALGCAGEGERLSAQITRELDTVREAVAGLPRLPTLIITGRNSHSLDSLFTAGGASFVSELVEVAGGRNLYADTDQDYLEASKETVVVKAPEVILEFHAGEDLPAEEQARFVGDWDQFPMLPAVANDRVHLVLESFTLRPGPRIAKTARLLAALLHPEADLPEP